MISQRAAESGLRPGAECPLCGEEIQPSTVLVIRCPACRTYYHLNCWRFCGNRCGRLGCGGVDTESRGVQAAAAVASASLAGSVLTIGPKEIAQALRRNPPSSRRRLPLHPVWTVRARAELVGAALGLALGGLVRLQSLLLAWAMGEQRFEAALGLGAIAGLPSNPLLYAAGGLVYGLLQRRVARAELRFYKVMRLVLTAPALGLLGYLGGRSLLFPSYRWPSVLWGLAGELLWMAPILAWVALGFGVVTSLAHYSKPISLFTLAASLYLILAVCCVSAYFGAVFPALFFGGLAWLVGSGVDFFAEGHDFSTSWRGAMFVFFGSVGYLGGIARVIGSFQQAQRRGGAAT